MFKVPKITFFFFIFFLCKGAIADLEAPKAALQAVSLVNYIAGDYQGAVATEGGEILSATEYNEMKDFSSIVGVNLKSLISRNQDPLLKTWATFNLAIGRKESLATVSQLAKTLKEGILSRFGIATAPPFPPDLERGLKIYGEHCSSCHGQTGMADTPTAHSLSPSPTPLADPSRIDRLSPFQVFTILQFGVQKTAMPAFTDFPESDRWNIATALFLLRRNLPPPSGEKPPLSWNESLALSNEEIISRFQGLQALSDIRHLGVSLKTPSQGEALSGINFSIQQVHAAITETEAGNFSKALELAVSAYLDGFEKTEGILKVLGKKELVQKMEALFIQWRQEIRSGNVTHDSEQNLLKGLQETQNTLEASRSFSPSVAFLASLTIIFREGLEAILLLAIIFSVARSLGNPLLTKWIHLSWIGALVAGFVTWLLAREIISGAAREGMEGWVGLVASATLVYVSFWLHGKRNVELWKKFLINKIKGKQSLGHYTIASVAFLAVYREVFETILFFETLKIQAGPQTIPLGLGVLAGFVILLLVAWIVLKLGKKIPLNLFFGFSTVFLFLMAVVFVGQSIHNLQEANFLPHSPLPFFTLPALGIFPSLQSLIAQAGLLFIFAAALFWQQWVKGPQDESRLENKMALASLELFDAHELEEHLMEHLSQIKDKVGQSHFSGDEMKEIIGHMQDLDHGIHRALALLVELQAEIPRRFGEIFEEIQILQKDPNSQKLVERAVAFKEHLESLKIKN